MSDPKFSALNDQVQAINAQIQTESSARAAADEALASRVTASEVVIAEVKLKVDGEDLKKFGENILLERRLTEIERRLGIA